MEIAIVENGVIVNVIVVPEGADPARFGGIPLPEGLWIGDALPDPESTVWDDLDAAYREGVNAV